MSTQYSFAPYQDPPEDIPAHEREQAAHSSASHYSSEGMNGPAQGDDTFLASEAEEGGINQYETSLPLRLIVFSRKSY
jgi:hypothetical protein